MVLSIRNPFYTGTILKQQQPYALWNDVSEQNSCFDTIRRNFFKEAFSCNSVRQHSGYIDISDEDKIFYVFFESPNNASQTPVKLQLSSIAIGNGLIDPRIQFKAYFKMACQGEQMLLPTAVCDSIKRDLAEAYKKLDACYSSLNTITCKRAWKMVDDAILVPYINNGRALYNINDIKFKLDEHPIKTNSTEFFFNQHHIQFSLGVSDTDYKVISYDVYSSFYNSGDIMVTLKSTLESLLNRGVKVLLYAGDADFLCNWVGLQDLTEQLDWREGENFKTQKLRYYYDNEIKKVVWQLRAYQNLFFVRLHDAGHMVSYCVIL
ncbi:hypothetical protein L0F63_002041 [Massospora cicadina]|nr:hypothetical protein L0F63_002041 [Massospora cicadina]